jgi:hypothetical protein
MNLLVVSHLNEVREVNACREVVATRPHISSSKQLYVYPFGIESYSLYKRTNQILVLYIPVFRFLCRRWKDVE